MRFYDDSWVSEQTTGNFVPEISLVDNDTFTEASQYNKPCCLNFASHKRPGGGYKSSKFASKAKSGRPIKTQEEDLFRRSNLPEILDVESLYRECYPLKGLKGIYCEAIVNKDKKVQPCTEFVVSVITVAAVVNPTYEDLDLIKNKVKRIFDIAADNHQETLILGAWGCGVFHNDPELIAHLFMEQTKRNLIKKVVFAIPDKTSSVYKIFEKAIV